MSHTLRAVAALLIATTIMAAPDARAAGSWRASLTPAEHGRHVRYLLEKIAAAQRTLVQRVTGGDAVHRIVATGGGARSAVWLQIKADLIGVPVITPASPVYTSRWGNPGIVYNLDAMFVALNYSLPTLNGYSAWFPDGWRLFDPSHSGYPQAVASWVQQRGLTDVCAFDIEERKMRPYRP